MLISMPTGTSTIFGVFQVIGFSHVMVRHSHRPIRKTAARLTQGLVRLAPQIGLPEQTQQRSSCRRTQFPGIKRSVGVPVGCVETLLDDGQVLIQRQGSVMIGVSRSKLACAQSPGQFAFVECAVVVRIEPHKQLCCGFLDFREIERAVRVEIEHPDRIVTGSRQSGRSLCQKCSG